MLTKSEFDDLLDRYLTSELLPTQRHYELLEQWSAHLAQEPPVALTEVELAAVKERIWARIEEITRIED